MGLFSGKTKIYVSSVVYPLGEDDDASDNKIDYLKYTVLNATMQGRPIAESISNGYLKGQGMSLRNVFGYARDHYTDGVPVSAAKYLDAPNRDELTAVLQPKHPGSTLDYLTVVVGTADFEWFAEQYLAKEYGYDRTSGEFERPPSGVDADAAIAYDLETDGTIRILLMNADATTTVVSFRPTEYVQMADFIHCAYQAVQVFDSGIVTTTRAAEPGEVDHVSIVTSIIERAGEVQTTTTRTTVDVTGSDAVVKVSKITEVRTRPQYFLYQLGKGTYPTLDAWVHSEDLVAPYYPAIPLRVDSTDITDEAHQETDLYKTSKKLLNRLGLKIDDLSESLNDNEGVKDIDFAFVVFGVKLNTKSQDGKRYLFRYFEYLRGITSADTTKASHTAWAAGAGATPPPMNIVEIYSEKNRDKNYDIKLQWDYINTEIKSGEAFPGARKGDVDISMDGTRTEFQFLTLGLTLDSSKLYARRQIDEDTYEELEVSGFYYENFIYKGKSVSISAYDAFHDDDIEGFIVPLNQQVLRALSLRDLTDLAYHCCHMVMNCYQVVKQKWYQTGIFRVILFIIAVILCYFFPPAGVAMLSTLIATVVVVSVIIAMIIASIIYVLAMMIVANILMRLAVQVFGEKWGPIIGTILMLVAGNWGSIGTTASTAASTGITAMQVIQATTAVLNLYGQYANWQTAQVAKDITKLNEEYEKKFDELEEMTEKMLGTNTDLLDIQGMTDATYRHYFEPMDAFLTRTLITGGDVCDITLDQISNFAGLGLQLPTNG